MLMKLTTGVNFGNYFERAIIKSWIVLHQYVRLFPFVKRCSFLAFFSSKNGWYNYLPQVSVKIMTEGAISTTPTTPLRFMGFELL